MRFTVILAQAFFLAAPASAAAKVDYLRDVKPILARRCYACHGALQQRSNLRVDTAEAIRKGGDRGPAVMVGKSDASPLIDHVRGTNGLRRMPPRDEGEPLHEREVNVLKAWIDQGANSPAGEKPEPDPRDHWAFRTPVRPAVPTPKDVARACNSIDAFLAEAHAKHRLTSQPAADRRVLLRRVYLDLIGLPPTLAEQDAFLADSSPNAYERVVERLLQSPQYGERWGRHWMDVWRYSDWWGLGAEVRNSQKHIWHWRDWIIESLNADKGYDQILREMLAADELYPNDLGRLRATGYLARSYFKFNRNTWLDEVVEHTGKAFLGLTLNCAKCHDHKYDPIAQLDYYRMRAFFEPYQIRTDQLPGEIDLEKNGLPRVFDCNLNAPTYVFLRGNESQPRKDKSVVAGIPALLAMGELEIRPIDLPVESHRPALRPFVLEDHLRSADRELTAAREALGRVKAEAESGANSLGLAERRLAVAEAQVAAVRARAAADRATPANAKDLAREAARAEREFAARRAEETVARAEADVLRADDKKKPELEKKLAAARDVATKARKAVETPGETYTPLRGALKTLESNMENEASRNKPFPTTSTGRRSALAHWLTDARHPLTARVAVNHIWTRHFGRPLVPTIFDFGRKGTPPTHPALLDYLAVEFMENGWSFKHLHRLMVTSHAYQISSSSANAAPANLANDGDNRWYWRMNSVRLDAQALRDSLLHLAGDLDTTMSGPPVPVANEASPRRALYFVHSHNDQQKFLAMFDNANVLECYRRAESIVPQQALALANSRLALSAAEKIAAHIGDLPDPEFVRAAFATVLANVPTPDEQRECEQTLVRLVKLLKQGKQANPERRARVTLVEVLVNHNDFVTIR